MRESRTTLKWCCAHDISSRPACVVVVPAGWLGFNVPAGKLALKASEPCSSRGPVFPHPPATWICHFRPRVTLKNIETPLQVPPPLLPLAPGPQRLTPPLASLRYPSTLLPQPFNLETAASQVAQAHSQRRTRPPRSHSMVQVAANAVHQPSLARASVEKKMCVCATTMR